MKLEKGIRLVKILLTIGALEFFGPILRDTNVSHLLNPEWVGHARFHLMWNISLWGCLGLYSIFLLWISKSTNIETLYHILLLQFLNSIAFWSSVALGDFYGADVFDEKIHVGILNINENVFVFTCLTLLTLVNFFLIKFKLSPLYELDKENSK